MQRGWSNQTIADEYLLSLGTVKSHTRDIFQKLGVQGRTDFTHQAAQQLILQFKEHGGGSGLDLSEGSLPETQGTRVTCVVKSKSGSGHEAITHLGGRGWKWPITDVIESICSGTSMVYTLIGGRRAQIVVVKGKNGTYLQASVDGFGNDDLLMLDECS
jgi:hypothetical protein